MRIAVIADDLTGAADTGAALVRAGHRTAVAFRGERVDADAVVIDTDSRGLPAAEAAARVRAVALGGAEIVMKKVDSTLRGPLAAEVDGGTGRERAHASDRRTRVPRHRPHDGRRRPAPRRRARARDPVRARPRLPGARVGSAQVAPERRCP